MPLTTYIMNQQYRCRRVVEDEGEDASWASIPVTCPCVPIYATNICGKPQIFSIQNLPYFNQVFSIGKLCFL